MATDVRTVYTVVKHCSTIELSGIAQPHVTGRERERERERERDKSYRSGIARSMHMSSQAQPDPSYNIYHVSFVLF